MNRLLVATKNKNKLKEISQILIDLGINVSSAYEVIESDMDIEETGSTFEENARLKSETISMLTDHFVIADDSGLEVDFLDRAPGVYSARYAGDGATDESNNDKLLNALKDIPLSRRTARFVCAISLSLKGKTITTFRGTCEGKISKEKIGSHGFGYDPLFLLESGKTMAELAVEEKNYISHRARALLQLREFIVSQKDKL